MNEQHFNEICALAKNKEEQVNYLQRFSLFGHMFDNHVGVTLANTHTVKGTPTLSADGVFGRAVASGNLRFKWLELSEESVTMYAIRLDQSDDDFKNDITKTLTLENCIKRGVARAPTWKQYPEQMLMSKVKTFVARALFPDVVGGIYGVEELSEDDVQVLKALEIEEVPKNNEPRQLPSPPIKPPSNPTTIPPQKKVEPPKFNPKLSLNAKDLLDQCARKGFNNTLLMNNFAQLESMYENLFDLDAEKIRFGRFCFESSRHLGLAVHLGVNTLRLIGVDFWQEHKDSRLIKSAIELAKDNGFVEAPWDYYRGIFNS